MLALEGIGCCEGEDFGGAVGGSRVGPGAGWEGVDATGGFVDGGCVAGGECVQRGYGGHG